MNGLLLAVAVGELVVIGLIMVRLALGPSVTDRLVAFNLLSLQAAVAVLVFAAAADRSIYLDVAIWLCSFGYLGGLVWARYLERGLL